jgi:hypothetical protein
MADKKFKTGVDLQSSVKLSNKSANRALIINGSNELVESLVTDTELSHLDGVTSAIQTQMDAKADLVGGKIPSGQLPAIAITEVFTAADIAARDALTVGTGDGEIQEGDVVIVTDASADAGITSGSASYIYDGAAYQLLKAGDEVLSVNTQTGAVVLDADDISDAATTNKFVTAAQIAALHDAATLNADDATQQTLNLSGQEIQVNLASPTTDGAMSGEDKDKLDDIELLADVTDATNVAAAGATMDADTSLVGNGYFLDEDNMASDDATKVPSQQSVKAYVDNNSGNVSAGDIKETSFAGADAATNADVDGLLFANGVARSFDCQISVVIDATADLYENFRLLGVQKGAVWDMAVESVGDDSGISFDIDNTGQVTYSKVASAGYVSNTMKFRADTTSV